MKLALTEAEGKNGVATLRGALPPQRQPVTLRYHTDTGALLRVDELAIGAYDREHRDVWVAAGDRERLLELEVELHSLPTNGLPAGPGLMWWWLNARARERPSRSITVTSTNGSERFEDAAGAEVRPIPLIGHSHLDVAWLWTYEQTVRKAQRTFAIACDLCDRDPHFRFAQSQPQLYRFVEESDTGLFERMRDHVRTGRFDPDVAALWVESDCNVPSGESLLRQMLFAHRYCVERLGVTPAIAWLPDSFGFANTLPQLLAHAGIPFFATTKLQWNDTTRFPYPQFVWRGPDGTGVIAALIQSYDGPAYPWRVRTARKRNEPLVLGYGDGGGGVTTGMLREAPRIGRWIRPREWLQDVQARGALPVHADELYLEYHRGVYTTHHDVKFHNALLERSLAEAEELAAWCIAVHAPAAATRQFAGRLHQAWEIVLRNQFHDVLPGTSIAPVYEDAAREYAEAEEAVAAVISSAQTILPRTPVGIAQGSAVAPVDESGAFRLENGLVSVRIDRHGTLTELHAKDGSRVHARANMLALYRDRPRHWEAWNIDDGYQRTRRIVQGANARIEDSALLVDFLLGRSPAAMRIELRANEPFVRVSLLVDWRERRRLLRVENEFRIAADRVVYGSPHGTVERSALRDTPEDRAKFEVPGQRFAAVRNGNAAAAILSLDTYGWSAAANPGRISIGHSLLRGTTWPDPRADLGEHAILYAFLPLKGMRAGQLEDAWLRFAHGPRVRLFRSEDDAVAVAACKPAHEGTGVVVRARECDGKARRARLQCGARMTGAIAVDALERPLEGSVTIEAEALVFDLAPFQIRSFRVQFGT